MMTDGSRSSLFWLTIGKRPSRWLGSMEALTFSRALTNPRGHAQEMKEGALRVLRWKPAMNIGEILIWESTNALLLIPVRGWTWPSLRHGHRRLRSRIKRRRHTQRHRCACWGETAGILPSAEGHFWLATFVQRKRHRRS